jgi:hypothetical protein
VSQAAPSGQPIEIGIGQRAVVSNTGSTSGAPTAAGASVSGSSLSAPSSPSGGATAKGLSASNNVENTGLVDVTIGGNNYAPINIAVKTITTIVNAATALVETAAGGGPGGATADTTGLGTRASNNVNLDATAAVQIAGDNHNPIRIVLDIGAELWNRGMALLGRGPTTSGAASATGLEVDNILKLLGRASVKIGGSNYAPIDIDIILQNLIYNAGVAEARGGADGGAAAGSAGNAGTNASSGPASCLSLLATAGVVNGQAASVKLPEDAVRRQLQAANTHVVDVQGLGTARCSTGNVTTSGGTATSGDVQIGGGGTVLTVVSTQVADTSAKTGPASSSNPVPPSQGGGQPVQVVVAVTTTPVTVPGKKSGSGTTQSVKEEDQWEWTVVWEPLYVIYPQEEVQVEDPVASGPPPDIMETETTTSMAGSFHAIPVAAAVVRPSVDTFGLVDQMVLAFLGLLAFLLLTILKRRLHAIQVRMAALRKPQLHVITGGVADAAD